MGRRPKQTFFQRRHIDGQQAHEKMLTTANHYRNANQAITSYQLESCVHICSLAQPSCARCTLHPPGPGSLLTCFGYLVHRHTQLLRHVAQHGEDGKASQDAGDGVAQGDNEGVSARISPGTGRGEWPPSSPTRPSPASHSPTHSSRRGPRGSTDL